MSLRNKLLSTILAMLLVANTIAYFGIQYSFSGFINERFGNVISRNTEIAKSQIESTLDFYEHISNGLLVSIEHFTGESGELNTSEIEKFLEDFVKENPTISGLRIQKSSNKLIEYYQISSLKVK